MLNQQQLIRYHALMASNNGKTSDVLLHKPWEIRTLFMSDIHLGYLRCMAGPVVGILNHVVPANIYLVGDFVDGWSFGITGLQHMGRMFHSAARECSLRLPQAQVDIGQKLLRHARAGAYVFWIPGNHDDALRAHLPVVPDLPECLIDSRLQQAEKNKIKFKLLPDVDNPLGEVFHGLLELGNTFIVHDMVHVTADNRRLMVMHGDELGSSFKDARLMGRLGTKARDNLYDLSEWVRRNQENPLVRKASRLLIGKGQTLAELIDSYKTASDEALPQLSSQFVLTRNELIRQRAASSMEWAREPLLDGIIVGHNHIPAAEYVNGVRYYNCGSAVNPTLGVTALAEHYDGRISLIRYVDGKGLETLIDDIEPDSLPGLPKYRSPQPSTTVPAS